MLQYILNPKSAIDSFLFHCILLDTFMGDYKTLLIFIKPPSTWVITTTNNNVLGISQNYIEIFRIFRGPLKVSVLMWKATGEK